MEGPVGVGAPRSLQNLTHYHNLLAVRCSPQPKDAQTLEPMPNFKEPDLERRRAMALLLLHHVKNVRIAAFSSRESHSGGHGVYRSRLGVLLMREMPRGGRIRGCKVPSREKESEISSNFCLHHHQLYAKVRCEPSRAQDSVLLIHMRIMSYPGVSSLALFCTTSLHISTDPLFLTCGGIIFDAFLIVVN